MTVNVALEDVPWAILEMVKARIMANRRRLLEEDQTDAATQPVQTLQSIDARGNRWGEEEPAATLIYVVQDVVQDDNQIVIWWPTFSPAIGIARPSRTEVPGEFSGDDAYESADNLWLINPVEGEGSRFVAWQFAFNKFGIGTGDFTLEFYAKIDAIVPNLEALSFGAYNASIYYKSFDDRSESVSLTQERLSLLAAPETYQTTAGDFIEGVPEEETRFAREYRVDVAGSTVPTDQLSHCSLQRINGVLYVHFNGTPGAESFNLLGDQVINYGQDQLFLELTLTNANNGLVYAGQCRITKSALYGTGTYTPPTDPFYDPTQ
jgi:hypothetical protein